MARCEVIVTAEGVACAKLTAAALERRGRNAISIADVAMGWRAACHGC